MSVHPTSPNTAWRGLVIGAVAVLAAGIGVAAGSFLLTARAASLGSAAAYVPANAPFYVELRVEPSAAQDAALRELLGHFPSIDGVDAERPLFEQLTEHIDEMLLAEETTISWEEDVDPWFDGRVAFAVTELEIAAPDSDDPLAPPPLPDWVAMVGVTDVAAADAAIERVIAEAGADAPTFTETQHAGITIHASDAGEGAYAITDDQVVLGQSADAIRAAIDTRAAAGSSLAEAEAITSLTEQLPSDWLVFGTYDMTGLMADALAQADAEAAGITEAFGELFAHQPARGAFAISADGDRLWMDGASDAPTGPLAPENANRGLADEVPSDALYYSESGNIGEMLVAVIEPLKQAALEDPTVAEQVETFEAALGADLEELFVWIDDGAIVLGWDGESPYGGFVLVPNDMDAAQRRLDQLASFAELGSLDPSSGVSVTEEQVGDATITTIRWEDASAEPDRVLPTPPGVVVEYTVTSDRVLIGLGDTFVRRALELDAADALAAEPRYTDALSELGGVTNAGVTWIDLAGAREALEAALLPMAEAMPGADAYATEVEPWLAPLDRFVTVARLDGEVLVQRAALIVD